MKTEPTPLPSSHQGGTDSGFAVTRWTLIQWAGGGDAEKSAVALDQLCKIYWPAVFAYIRRRSAQEADAKDLTQGFFLHLLNGFPFGDLSPTRGRFRAYLLQSVKNFLNSEHRHASRQKRGGGARHLSFDVPDGEVKNLPELNDPHSPERAFDRTLAHCLLDQVLERLAQEHSTPKDALLFQALRPLLSLEDEPETYETIAAQLDMAMTAGALRTEAHRLRKRYQKLLREELGRICAPEFVEEELEALKNALAS